MFAILLLWKGETFPLLLFIIQKVMQMFANLFIIVLKDTFWICSTEYTIKWLKGLASV